MTFLVALDGVLRSDNKTPIREGRMLFEALRATGRAVVLLDEPRAMADHWMKMHGIKGLDDVIDNEVQLVPDDDLRKRQIRVARAMGRVDLVVDSNPEIVHWCLEQGVAAALFVHPTYMLPRNRERAAWDDIVSSLEKQADFRG